MGRVATVRRAERRLRFWDLPLYTANHSSRETVGMKNITVAVDDATYRRARIRAAELDTSVSALVREFLRRLSGGRPAGHSMEAEQKPHEQYETRLDDLFADWDARGIGLRGHDRLTRDEVHDRARARLEMETSAAKQRRGVLVTDLVDRKTRTEQAQAAGQADTVEDNAQV